jgi:drug/metabolite transporter (DMT)-like permease
LLTNLMTNSSPLWVAIMEVAILKAFLSKRVWMGILLALAGMVLFALAGLDGGGDMGSDPLLGGGIALLSAFIAAIYFIVGRTVRARVSTLVFLWIGLVAGAVVMLVINLVTGTSLTGYSLEGYALILIVTITGQIVGQAMLAYCLAHFPATFVSIALQMLVILSALEAFFVFGEQPGPLQILASAVILAGVIMVISGRNPAQVRQ